MHQEPEFPFDRAKRVTPAENQKFRAAISEQFGLDLKKRGRPSKEEEDKYEPISIRKLVRSKIAMNAKLVDSLAQIIQTLTVAERQELDAKISTPVQNSKIIDSSRSVGSGESARFQQWDKISDADAAALKAEFAQEDIAFAETILPEYSSNLQQEDCA